MQDEDRTRAMAFLKHQGVKLHKDLVVAVTKVVQCCAMQADSSGVVPMSPGSVVDAICMQAVMTPHSQENLTPLNSLTALRYYTTLITADLVQERMLIHVRVSPTLCAYS